MAAQALMAGLNIATSALPLFFGENNILSGKAREASREQEAAFRRSQGMQLPTEYTQALQNRLAQANVGIPSAALGLYQQQAGRAQAGQLAGLRDRRSALAGIGGIAQAGQDAALQLAYMQSQALLSGQERANQALMQMGGLKYQEELRKQEEAQQYWGGRKAEANAAVSSALAGVGQAMGSALSTGAFQGQPKLPTTPTPPGLSAMNYLSGNTTTPLATYSFSGLSNLPRINTVYPYSNTFGMINRGTKIGQYSTTGLLGLKGPN